MRGNRGRLRLLPRTLGYLTPRGDAHYSFLRRRIQGLFAEFSRRRSALLRMNRSAHSTSPPQPREAAQKRPICGSIFSSSSVNTLRPRFNARRIHRSRKRTPSPADQRRSFLRTQRNRRGLDIPAVPTFADETAESRVFCQSRRTPGHGKRIPPALRQHLWRRALTLASWPHYAPASMIQVDRFIRSNS